MRIARRDVIAGAGGLAAAMVARPARAEAVLRAVSGVPTASPIAQVFVRYMDRVNERARGVVRIHYIGGPEVTPSPRQPAALQRGLFDMLYTPGAFHAGEVPEVDAVLGSNRSITEMRGNGGVEALSEAWVRRLGARILGWFDTTVAFHFFLARRPPDGPNGLDLSGLRMFTTPTFRDFQVALGATPVTMALGEIRQSMERGVIQGFGWPNFGMLGIGLEAVAKVRVDPEFCRGNSLVLVNDERWRALPAEARAALDEAALGWEAESAAFIDAERQREIAVLAQNGMEVLRLSPEASARYLGLAYGFHWARLAQRAPEAAPRLRGLLFDDARLRIG
jgi:TRAP-type C4-dicarboxylate transport system substrate-binding protein